jgi:Tfp pilus assembly protein PilE
MNLAQKLEQHYSVHQNYQFDISPHAPNSQYYRYTLRHESNSDEFTLMATPIGAQEGDECGVLLLNERLLRGAGNQLDNRAALTLDCWDGK